MYVYIYMYNMIIMCTYMYVYKGTYLQASYGGGQELVAQLSGVHQHEPEVLVDRAVFGSDVL